VLCSRVHMGLWSRFRDPLPPSCRTASPITQSTVKQALARWLLLCLPSAQHSDTCAATALPMGPDERDPYCARHFLEQPMRRISIFLFVSLAALATYACGSATPTGDTPNSNASTEQPADGDKCPLLDAGPPPECPEGCVWNGKECRKNSSIVMPDNHGDGGTNPPTK